MKTSKRILSAVLASTTALSSMVAYAEDTDNTTTGGETTGTTGGDVSQGEDNNGEIKNLKAYIGNGADGTVENPETMQDQSKATYLANYKHNRGLYSGELIDSNDGNYTLNIKAQYGAMRGTATLGEGGKNVLVVLEMDKLTTGYSVKKGDTEITEANAGGWLTHGSKFIDGNADDKAGKTYVTLWISLTDERVRGTEDVVYTITDKDDVEKTITVNIEDTTEYTLNAPTAAEGDKYTVNIANGSTNSNKKVTLTPIDGVEIKSATVKGITFTKDTGKESWSGEIDVNNVLTSDQIAAGTTTAALVVGDFTVATVEDKIHLTGAGRSTVTTVPTMDTPGNERLTHNNGKITINPIVTSEDGKNYTITVDTKFGEMQGDPSVEATGGKNALIMLEFNATDVINIKKGDDVLPAEWKNDASKFVTAAAGKQYFTLWVSVTDTRIASDGVVYTIYNTQGGQTQEKTLTVKFTDSTVYSLTKDAELNETEYAVEVGTVGTNGKATVTVTPKSGKTITSAAVKKGDGVSTIPLTLNSDGTYSGEVTVKELLTAGQVANGITAVELTENEFTVVTADMSSITAENISLPASGVIIEDGQNVRFQKNLKLYGDSKVNSVIWNADSRTATVKVPAELMEGTGATGQNAANVCLVLKLNTLENSGWAESDNVVPATSSFVNGSADDESKYVVLWIGAGTEAFGANSTKTVRYTDNSEAVIATVNLVKVPGVRPSAVAKPTGIATTEAAIITAAKTLLTGDKSDDNLAFAVGTIPAASGAQDVTVTVTPKGDTVLVNGEGNVVTSLELTVGVTVAANATVNITEPTNGTFTVKAGDTEIADGETAEVGATITLTATPASGYKLGSWTATDSVGNAVTVASDNTFTMPAGGVTISATFTQNQTTPINPGTGGGSGGGSSRPSSSSGSSTGTSTTLNVTNKTIPTTANAVKDTERVNANSANSTGVAISVDKSDSKVSYAKIEAPSSTNEAALWAEAIIKKASADKAAEVKKAAEEAVNAVANSKGFALNVDILDTNRKTVEPGKNVEITVPVPAAYKDKTLYAYRITERGVVPVLMNVKDNKVTFNAGGAGEYIFTTEKLANALTQKKGDVDNGGKANTADATLVLKHIVDLGELKDERLYYADVNGDGKVNVADATEILKIVVGLA